MPFIIVIAVLAAVLLLWLGFRFHQRYSSISLHLCRRHASQVARQPDDVITVWQIEEKGRNFVVLQRGEDMARYPLAEHEQALDILVKLDLRCGILLIQRLDIAFSRIVKLNLPDDTRPLSQFTTLEIFNSDQVNMRLFDYVSAEEAGRARQFSAATREMLAQQMIHRFNIVGISDLSPSGKELLVNVGRPEVQLHESGTVIRYTYSFKRFNIETGEFHEVFPEPGNQGET